jgi:hypothetical protein
VAQRTQPVTEANIATFYAANRTQMQGRSLDEMRPILREFLEEQNSASAVAALVADLKKARPDLRVMLDPPRQQVEVLPDDPSEGPANAPVTLIDSRVQRGCCGTAGSCGAGGSWLVVFGPKGLDGRIGATSPGRPEPSGAGNVGIVGLVPVLFAGGLVARPGVGWALTGA